ncbi:MAG: hydroxymethylpyrimidine/phosphomethylpyrimidine kinase [Cyclobacteriaceae bacterium]|jgi:hydroxymethylpyrimidine/phosphomethylpyrimidine kinase
MKYLVLSLTLIFVSCGQDPSDSQPTNKELKEQVLAAHDVVMPKMEELRKIEKALRTAANEQMLLSESVKAVKATEAANVLAEANESMMQWMRSFDLNYKGTEEEVRAYLEEQKLFIDQVRFDMNTALDQGKSVLEKD